MCLDGGKWKLNDFKESFLLIIYRNYFGVVSDFKGLFFVFFVI